MMFVKKLGGHSNAKFNAAFISGYFFANSVQFMR